MLKSLAAFAIFSLLGAAVVALPGFAPKVQASETVALAKGDRQPVRTCAIKSGLTFQLPACVQPPKYMKSA